MSKQTVLILIVLAAALGLGFMLWTRNAPLQQVRSTFEGLPSTVGQFARITGPQELQFPRDLGAHPETQTEWWYFTGNLKTEDGRLFGYQLTFFRRALLAPDQLYPRPSAWAASQVYLAHFALSDSAQGNFYQSERIERGAAGLAGAVGMPVFQVWLHDWSVTQTAPTSYLLTASQDGIHLSLNLEDVKGWVLQGDRGYSQKGPEPGNASTYVSMTRLKTGGEVTLKGTRLTVSGSSWMDHEYGTSFLGAGQVGWDWFSIQLDNGIDLMVYNIRNQDGSVDLFSRGILVKADGTTRPLKADEFEITVESHWKSPHSGAVYPAGWIVKVPSQNLELKIEPLLADQELNNSFTYWEGAVKIQAKLSGADVVGVGYVELTGYARSFEGGF